MPPELWLDNPIDKQQRYSRYIEAANLLEKERKQSCHVETVQVLKEKAQKQVEVKEHVNQKQKLVQKEKGNQMMQITALQLAMRFVGLKEVGGASSNPQILAMLKLDDAWPWDDSVPWCSAFINYIAWLLRLPRSKSLRARSWLNVGVSVNIDDAYPGFDIVILKRGGDNQPGPNVIEAPGHVGFLVNKFYPVSATVSILGGNQSNMVSIAHYDATKILGIRRIYDK